MNKFIIILTILVLPSLSIADDGWIDFEDSWADYIEFRRDSTNKNLKGKAGRIFVQNYQQIDGDEDVDNSYAIDAALSLKIPMGETLLHKITIEQHKNTFEDEEATPQDQRTLKYSFEHQVALIEDSHSVKLLSLKPSYSFAVKKDAVADTRSGEFMVGTGFFSEKARVNDLGPNVNSEFLYYWSPALSIQYEDIIKADDGDPEGDVTRINGGIELGTYIMAKTLHKALALTVEYNYWKDIDKDDELGDKDSYPLTVITLSYNLNPARMIIDDKGKKVPYKPKVQPEIAIEYYNGENIIEGSPDQEYIGFTFGLKI